MTNPPLRASVPSSKCPKSSKYPPPPKPVFRVLLSAAQRVATLIQNVTLTSCFAGEPPFFTCQRSHSPGATPRPSGPMCACSPIKGRADSTVRTSASQSDTPGFATHATATRKEFFGESQQGADFRLRPCAPERRFPGGPGPLTIRRGPPWRSAGGLGAGLRPA